MLKKIIRNITPPIFLKAVKLLLQASKQTEQYGWFRGYSTWESALKECSGYNSSIILEKVKDSILKVKNGEAVYERDSCLFEQIQYSWALLSALYRCALEHNAQLSVIDFGGSLGSSYFQNRNELSAIKKLDWSVVEQQNFVEVGKKDIADNILQFYYTIDECVTQRKPQFLLLSSVLQYLEKPFEVIEQILSYNFEYIFIDRTSFTTESDDIITVQKVSPQIYSASYPCWFFNQEKLVAAFTTKYEVVYRFEALDKSNLPKTQHLGFFLKLRK